MADVESSIFTLNRNVGASVLHREHPHEACNTDDAEALEKVDARTAAALIESGQARRCEHCKPELD